MHLQYGAYAPTQTTAYIPYPVPETRDQFIRRWVEVRKDYDTIAKLIIEARNLWDESVKK